MTQEKLLALRSRAKNLLTKQIQQTMPEDVPEALAGARFVVAGGEVTRDG